MTSLRFSRLETSAPATKPSCTAIVSQEADVRDEVPLGAELRDHRRRREPRRHREHERDREQRERAAPLAQLVGGYAWPPNGCGSHPGWSRTSAPQAISTMPASGTARRPACGGLLEDHQRRQRRHPPQPRDAGGEHHEHQRPAAAQAVEAVQAAEPERARLAARGSGASRNDAGCRHLRRQRSLSELNWNAPASDERRAGDQPRPRREPGVASTTACTSASPQNASVRRTASRSARSRR